MVVCLLASFCFALVFLCPQTYDIIMVFLKVVSPLAFLCGRNGAFRFWLAAMGKRRGFGGLAICAYGGLQDWRLWDWRGRGVGSGKMGMYMDGDLSLRYDGNQCGIDGAF